MRFCAIAQNMSWIAIFYENGTIYRNFTFHEMRCIKNLILSFTALYQHDLYNSIIKKVTLPLYITDQHEQQSEHKFQELLAIFILKCIFILKNNKEISRRLYFITFHVIS